MLNSLFPGICVLCRSPSRRRIDLCLSCERAFKGNDRACHVCAAPLPASATGERVCGRCVATPPQRSLPRSARLRNVRAAFAVKRPIAYRRIALVDDVSTTGATAHAASAALLAGGAEEVHLWVAAKAL